MPENAEFSVGNAYRYDRRSAVRWIFSHVFRFKRFLFAAMACQLVSITMFTLAPARMRMSADSKSSKCAAHANAVAPSP